MKSKILIVEDEPAMVAGLRDNFEYEGYEVISAGDGVTGLERALKDSPDLVVLDVMMPRMSGLDVCKQLKAQRPAVPIIMLTARGQEIDKVVGLELGADDYVTKPFSVRELLARVRAVMRRADETMGKTYEDDHLNIDFDDIRVACDGVKIKLTIKRSFYVLRLTKPVLLAWKGDVRNRNSLRPDRLHHLFRLIRWHYLVFQSLEKDHWTRQPLGKVDR